MDLYFSRRRFLNTSFYTPRFRCGADGTSSLKEMYRVTTTKRPNSFMPDTSFIEYVGAEDEDKHYVVAKITWKWPSQDASFIEIDDKVFKLNEFLKIGAGFTNTDTNVRIGDELCVWKSSVFSPATLYDPKGATVAKYIPQVHGVRPIMRALSVQIGQLHVSADAASDAYLRDYAVASFFAYRACRYLMVLFTPWWREEEADFTGIRVQTKGAAASQGVSLV